MTEAYDGRQVVGMDLHRRRSVLVLQAGGTAASRRYCTAIFLAAHDCPARSHRV